MKDKTCLVCGDKALGYNFNAVSCESCKAFFRRNAFKEIRGRCEGKCEVTVESRSYCKHCRLQKCFVIGMKRELILNEQQKQQRRVKIHENRLRRQGVPVSTSADEGLSPDSKSSDDNSSIKSESEPHVLASGIDTEALDGLQEDQREKIVEVMKAFQLSFDAPMPYQPMTAPSSTDFLNMADSSVRRLVKMAKHLSIFRKLDQEDQICLLKGAVVEVLILRSAKMFDTSRQGWSVVKGGKQHSVSAASLKFGDDESMSFFGQYQRFATTLLSATQRDNVVLMLMIVMVVLSPDRSSLQAKEVVTQAQEMYADLLMEYINMRYPKERMFAKVLQKLADIRDLNETHTRMLMHMKVEELEPLVVEIFDMSS